MRLIQLSIKGWMNKENAVNPEEDWSYVFYKKTEGIGGCHLKQIKPNSEE